MSAQSQTPRVEDLYRANEPSLENRGKDLLQCYLRIMEACGEGNAEGVEHGLDILEDSLDYRPNPKLAFHLQQLYGYCRNCLNEGRLEEVCRIIQGLRTVWERAIASEPSNV